MPRPKNKEDLLALSSANYAKLNEIIDALPENRLQEEFIDDKLYRNIRDVIAHLHHWHTMVLEWYTTGERGEKPSIPAEGYTWKTLPELNKIIWKKYLSKDLHEVRSLFADSYAHVHQLIQERTNDELFEKKRYKWTGTTSLGAYLISSTTSHYDWAIKKIRKAFK